MEKSQNVDIDVFPRENNNSGDNGSLESFNVTLDNFHAPLGTYNTPTVEMSLFSEQKSKTI